MPRLPTYIAHSPLKKSYLYDLEKCISRTESIGTDTETRAVVHGPLRNVMCIMCNLLVILQENLIE